jgi:hypothetical protein
MVEIERVFGQRIGGFLGEFIGKIREINQKYATPKIQLSDGAKMALLFLRLYLIFLVGLLIYKFWTIVHGGGL